MDIIEESKEFSINDTGHNDTNVNEIDEKMNMAAQSTRSSAHGKGDSNATNIIKNNLLNLMMSHLDSLS